MSREVRITIGDLEAVAELNDTKTADVLWAALPIRARASTWGDEIYFGIPVNAVEENAKDVVEMGDVGYWPPGHAFCIFFGPTPASTGSEIRPASPVNVIGKIKGDARIFKTVSPGEQVLLERM